MVYCEPFEKMMMMMMIMMVMIMMVMVDDKENNGECLARKAMVCCEPFEYIIREACL